MSRILTIDFTKSFIDELAGYLDREYLSQKRPLDRLAVVFGGRRPAHFLKRALSRKIGTSFIPPRFFTIDEFMNYAANKSGTLVSSADLDDCFELFTLARKVAPELLHAHGTFARFLPWARDILEFIGQLDLEDVSAKALADIQENARIGYPVPESINMLLKNILELREVFHARLREQGRTSRGLQYLRAREGIGQVSWEEFDDIIFANFFYFHRTEEALVKDLYARGKATLIFQGDQRKWPVLEHIAKRLDCRIVEGDEPTPTTFELKVHSAFDVHAEAAVVCGVLAASPDLDRTVVVLPDTGSLVPLLSSLPQEVDDFNVSMGYPLKRGSLYVLLQQMFRAQLSRRDGRYYSQDYLKVLRHPFVKNLHFSEDVPLMRVLVHKLEEILTGRIVAELSGSSFIDLKAVVKENALFNEACQTLHAMGHAVDEVELAQALEMAHGFLFKAWENVGDFRSFATALGDFLDTMSQKNLLQHYRLNVTLAGRMYDIKDEFAGAAFGQEPFTFEEIFRIFEDKVERELVSFSGTPLKGLQLLGLFETRSLNFDNVIIMDANEGVLPRLEIRSGLVPREVMTALKIDRLELEEEIQRYQFMRLISSAKQVHLIYQKNREKEPSRFVEELIWEDQKKQGKTVPFPMEHVGFGVRVAAAQRKVRKTPLALEFLRHFTFSASSVNLYLNNPYEFYTTYVLGLREEEDLLDEPDAILVGTFLHEILQEIYTPFLDRPLVIDAAFEERLWKIFERRFQDRFVRRMRSDAFLVRSVMEHKLRYFLEAERARVPFVEKIIGLERDFAGTIDLASGPYAFKARVDRVEEMKGGGLLVIDYKTGSTDEMAPAVLELPAKLSREAIFESVGSFQLPLYIHFVSENYPEARINAALYSLRESNLKPLFKEKDPVPAARDFLAPYWNALNFVISEILDPQIPFEDNPLKKYGD